jgi:single-strand DNA-binding protein
VSGYVNKVMLVGNVGRDPEIRSTHSGTKIASFSIATSDTWRDKATGERKERTEWHRISVWNEGLVGIVERYVRKGDKVYIEGKLETRKWTDQSGQERESTEIVLRSFGGELTMLSSKNSGAGYSGGGRGNRDYDDDSYGGGGGGFGGGGGRGRSREELDDDIPF